MHKVTPPFSHEQEYEDASPPRAPLDSTPSYKEEEYEDASPKAHLPVPEVLPPPPPEPAVVEPVGDLLVISCSSIFVELVPAQNILE